MNAFYSAMDELLGFSFDGSGGIVDATYRRDDPDFIADTDFAVRAAESGKKAILGSRQGRYIPVVSIGQQVTKACL